MKTICKTSVLSEKSGQYTWYDVTFENGMAGRTMSKFDVGVEYDIEEEERENQRGKYKYIKKLSDPNKKKFEGRDVVELIVSTGLSYTKNLMLLPKFDGMTIADISEAIVRPMLEQEKELQTKREKAQISPCMSYAIDLYKDEEYLKKTYARLKVQGVPTAQEDLKLIVKIFHQFLRSALLLQK